MGIAQSHKEGPRRVGLGISIRDSLDRDHTRTARFRYNWCVQFFHFASARWSHNKLTSISVSAEPLPGVHACVTTTVPGYFYALWVPGLIFESLLLLLVLFAFFNGLINMRNRNMGGIIKVLVCDNIINFIVYVDRSPSEKNAYWTYDYYIWSVYSQFT